MDSNYKFKAWQPFEGFQTIAIADDFDAIMWGLEHQVDIFTQDDKLVYSPNDDEESNFERLAKYGVRCVDDAEGRRWERIEKSVELQAQTFVHDSLNEMKLTHFVLKEVDVVRGLDKSNQTNLIQCFDQVKSYRKSIGKDPEPTYIVINTDEDIQMVKEIIEVMKRYKKWG